MSFFLQWYAALPDTVKGAVLGASIAVFGIILNNVVTYINIGRQLKHDREQKSTERSVALKRDTYLGAAEHLFAGHYTIMALANLQEDHQQLLKDLRKTAPHVAKLQLLPDPELLDLMNQAMEAVTRQLLRMTILRGQATRESDDRKRTALQISLMKEALEAVAAVQAKAAPVAVVARRELGVDLDGAAYLSASSASTLRLKALTKELIDQLEQMKAGG